ncbi:hypothetical protein [Streptomyces cinnamoneus]|uniref:Uncharacterized protein n=1 Tax=Streptomyces cinnamoneus TaxID=53446 RepID=A0A918WPF3_STRCJ|nr:hypothetical protein [Streptomyces cinnamoneus]GHC68227.1 hypothetical protein GCM10010507_53320 [Streptomyces cinnamoneus]
MISTVASTAGDCQNGFHRLSARPTATKPSRYSANLRILKIEDLGRLWRLECLRASVNGPMNDGGAERHRRDRRESSESSQTMSGAEPEGDAPIPTTDLAASA